ncbi:type VI immunity family protein [Chromobacterium sp. Beijing]|uniref:type VI immunity family protein n=1 Tax=Chromobacterium sp. Beijing TaxID=2735795 RepID=UPI001F23768E|nr:type VI immunity family protein [Chromobacterium sp. Beijing]UJB32708.1 DUF3396 domain-containing protein [Chromobacterium sp. Beijing]
MEQVEMPRQLQRLQQYQDELVWTLGTDDAIVVRPGLIATFFFEGGSSIAVREKIVECFDYFHGQFGPHLKGKQIGSGNYTKMSKNGYAANRNAALANVDPHNALEWTLSSESTQERAPAYAMQCLTRRELHETWGHKSYLKFTLPHTLLFEKNGTSIYQNLVQFVCNALSPVHGYGGLSPVLPYDFDRYLPNEYELAQRFIGLDVDSMSFSAGAHELQNHIKGANWLTILGSQFIQKLGGETSLRAQLASWPNIVLSTYPGGLIIQAGEYPDLGAPEDGAPISYVAVNHVVKPIRTTEPGSLHYHLPQQNGFDKSETVSWYARFDGIPLPEGQPLPAQAVHGGRCEAGKPCPESGHWWTPAVENSRQYFTQGELMPDFSSSTYGSTIWYREPVSGAR